MIDFVPRCVWCEDQLDLDVQLNGDAQQVVCPRCGRRMMLRASAWYHSYALPEDAGRPRRNHAVPSIVPPASVGTIYLVGCGTAGPVKIGFTTKEPAERMAALQTGSPDTLHLLGSFRGTQEDERQLHARLVEHRLHGEWFRRCPPVIAAFRKAP